MKITKIIAVITSATLIAGCLASCSKDDSSSSGSDGDGTGWENETYYNAEHTDTGYNWGNVEIVGEDLFLPLFITNPRKGLFTQEQTSAAHTK